MSELAQQLVSVVDVSAPTFVKPTIDNLIATKNPHTPLTRRSFGFACQVNQLFSLYFFNATRQFRLVEVAYKLQYYGHA